MKSQGKKERRKDGRDKVEEGSPGVPFKCPRTSNPSNPFLLSDTSPRDSYGNPGQLPRGTNVKR